jgi:hypothetical protein
MNPIDGVDGVDMRTWSVRLHNNAMPSLDPKLLYETDSNVLASCGTLARITALHTGVHVEASIDTVDR